MRKLAIIAILVLAVFIIGCGSEAPAKTASKTTTTASKTTTTTAAKTTTQTATAAQEAASEEDDTRSYTDSTTGDTVTFRKVDTYTREKEATEKCDMDFPLECTKYFANSGTVYLTIKNIDYSSKLNEVTLTLNGEDCDPSGSFIEPGQIKQFECYVSSSMDWVTGTLEMTYYNPMKTLREKKTGLVSVKME